MSDLSDFRRMAHEPLQRRARRLEREKAELVERLEQAEAERDRLLTLPRCGCRRYCGDVPEHEDDSLAICRDLPRLAAHPPEEPVG